MVTGRAAALLAVLATLVAAAPAAAHQGPALQVPDGSVVAQATLTGAQPAVVTDEPLVLTGIVRNVSSQPLVDPLPVLRWSLDALQSGDDLDLVAQNPLFRYGRVDYRFTSPLPTLAPGEQAELSLEVPITELVPAPGVYVVGFDVLATLPDGPRVFVASARTTVPVEVSAEQPVPTALLWPLASAPSLLPDGRLADDALAAEVAPGGRLETLVRAATQSPVTWVVDPDLLATATTMVGGYETVTPPATGTGGGQAAGFLTLLASSLPPDADVRRLPSADPDVAGMLAAELDPADVTAVLDTSLDPSLEAGAVADLVGRPVPPLAVPTTPTTAALQAYAAAGTATVALSADAVSPSQEPAQGAGDGVPEGGTQDGVDQDGPLGASPVVRLEAGLTGVLTEPVPDPTGDPSVVADLATRQRLLSETALLVTGDSPPRGLVLAPPLRWAPTAAVASAALTAWQSAPWLTPVPLRQLPPAPAGSVAVVRDDLPPAQPVDAAVLAGLDGVEADLERLRPLFAEPPVSSVQWPLVQGRAMSSAWADRPEGGVAYVDALAAGVAGATDQIALVLSDSITLSSRSGRFPVTLVNDSASDVVVGVEFSSQNSTRLRVEDIPPTVLTAGEKRTFTATALATANGRVVVTAAVVTSEGQSVGPVSRAVVDVTNVGALGWMVVAAGALLLVASLLRTRLQRRTG